MVHTYISSIQNLIRAVEVQERKSAILLAHEGYIHEIIMMTETLV